MRWHTANRRRAARISWRRRGLEQIRAILDKMAEQLIQDLIQGYVDWERAILFGSAPEGRLFASGGLIGSSELQGRVVGAREDGCQLITIDHPEFVDPNPPAVPEGSYRCESCGRVFEKGWNEEEAKAEFAEAFPNEPLEGSAVICDDCYAEAMAWAKKEGLVA